MNIQQLDKEAKQREPESGEFRNEIDDDKKRFESYLKAAEEPEKGEHQFHLLGNCYLDGVGTQKDEKKALECFVKGDELGDGYCTWMLGEFYEKGSYGLEKNDKKTFQYYLKAANIEEFDQCQYKVAEFYENGFGTEKDVQKAFEYYTKAYEGGEKFAEKDLIRLKIKIQKSG
jgi:TPR repeat protein